MAESYLKDKKRLLPVAALCEGEYGVEGLFLGVPARIGAAGVEKIYEITLNEEEKELLSKTTDAVRKTVSECN